MSRFRETIDEYSSIGDEFDELSLSEFEPIYSSRRTRSPRTYNSRSRSPRSSYPRSVSRSRSLRSNSPINYSASRSRSPPSSQSRYVSRSPSRSASRSPSRSQSRYVSRSPSRSPPSWSRIRTNPVVRSPPSRSRRSGSRSSGSRNSGSRSGSRSSGSPMSVSNGSRCPSKSRSKIVTPVIKKSLERPAAPVKSFLKEKKEDLEFFDNLAPGDLITKEDADYYFDLKLANLNLERARDRLTRNLSEEFEEISKEEKSKSGFLENFKDNASDIMKSVNARLSELSSSS